MATITIPKELAQDKNLIVVPEVVYGEFLAWQRRMKSVRTFKPTSAEKKALARARKNLAKGKYLTLSDLKHALGIDS